uniref:Uncharacterized protein n=1 Tax=Gopherus agassizii TaxID=38772 RepID=A0A452I511_9SAUR
MSTKGSALSGTEGLLAGIPALGLGASSSAFATQTSSIALGLPFSATLACNLHAGPVRGSTYTHSSTNAPQSSPANLVPVPTPPATALPMHLSPVFYCHCCHPLDITGTNSLEQRTHMPMFFVGSVFYLNPSLAIQRCLGHKQGFTTHVLWAILCTSSILLSPLLFLTFLLRRVVVRHSGTIYGYVLHLSAQFSFTELCLEVGRE